MSETFNGVLKLALNGNLVSTLDLGTNNSNTSYTKSYTISNGTSADMANNIWTDTRTISASGSDDLDLAGVLANAYGTTLTFTKIKGIIVTAAAANTNLVLVGGNTNGFVNWVADKTDIIKVRPGGLFCVYAPDSTGYAVTGSTGDILTIANSSSGTSVTYDIIVIGCV